MNDVYKTPQSNLSDTSTGTKGSIEKGLNGDYSIDIIELIKGAWEKTEGAKLTIFLAAVVAGVIMMIASSIAQAIVGLIITPEGFISIFLYSLIPGLLILPVVQPLYAGLYMLGMRRAAGLPLDFSTVFSLFHKMMPLVILGLLMNVLITIGMMLFVIPGIYLAVSYILAIPLVIEKDLSPWEALETSRKAITKKWFHVFGLVLLTGLIVGISAIPLGIGLFWTIPLLLIVYGVLYNTIFGIELTE